MKQIFKSKRFIVLSIIFVIFATLLALTFVIAYYTKLPLYINSKEDFLNIRNKLDAYYELNVDLDLEGESILSFSDKDHPFTGSFNGNGHTIKNLKLKDSENKDNYTVDDVYYYGLFAFNQGQIFNTNITNVTFDDMSFKDTTITKAYISLLVGHNSKETSAIRKINIDSELKLTIIGLDNVNAYSPFVAYSSEGDISENTTKNYIVLTKKDD